MPSCCFYKCLNHSGSHNKSSGITFHAFPNDELLRYKWLRVVRKQRRELDWVATINSRICSFHFKSDDMYLTDKGLRRIKRGAVPFVQMSLNTDTDLESDCNSPNGLEDVDISDCESIFESPTESYLKRKLRKISIKKKKLHMENKNLKAKNKRLEEKCNTLKDMVQSLKKKLNLEKTSLKKSVEEQK